jgi:hypothetical protein
MLSGRAEVAARRNVLRALALLVTALGTTGCSHLKWPWHHEPPPPPKPVHVLDVSGTGASAVLGQYWKRNTLILDMTAASGSGSLTLRPPADGWPVRVALRVTPGALGELDVRGGERVVLPIMPGAGKPVDLELSPGVYSPKTTEVTVAWGPAASPAT